MNILFYSPFVRRSRDVETLMLSFKAEGHNVISLTQQHQGNEINTFLNSKGISTFSFPVSTRIGFLYHLRHLFYFIFFVRKNNIDIIFSHLDSSNFIVSIAQYFITGKAYLCRHHINEASLYNYDQSLAYRLTYVLAKKIIVVSAQAKEYMMVHEKVSATKIIHINLGYDFSLYEKPNQKSVTAIINQHPCDVLLLTICRLTNYKRPQLSIRIVKELSNRGIHAKLIILGSGEMRMELENLVKEFSLEQQVSFPGQVSNIMDYLAAADYLVHPSVLESSCVVVKEAGLAKKPVIVCSGVGDFGSYMKNEKNSFLVSTENFVMEGTSIIENTYLNKTALTVMGENLNKDIVSLFSISKVLPLYNNLLKDTHHD